MTIKNILTKLMGSRYFHSNVNNWSILKRGNVHLNHMIIKINPPVFPKNQIIEGIASIMALNPFQPQICKGIQPPKNKVVAIPATINIFRYSAR